MKVTIYSLDYDGCGDILFSDLLNGQEIQPLLEVKKRFSDYLDSKAADADSVEVYVGSNRQSYGLNKFNTEHNKNGSCFLNYQRLCNDKKWTFRTLLLADNEDESGHQYE